MLVDLYYNALNLVDALIAQWIWESGTGSSYAVLM